MPPSYSDEEGAQGLPFKFVEQPLTAERQVSASFDVGQPAATGEQELPRRSALAQALNVDSVPALLPVVAFSQELAPSEELPHQELAPRRVCRVSTAGNEELGRPRVCRVSTLQREAIRELPDLSNRIADLGLSMEYRAFRDRYMGWRSGNAVGASGELNPRDLCRTNKGFGYWYPSKSVWSWRRTISYWISVTFFEGSLFFTISSFLACYPEKLGIYGFVTTTAGYIAGKVCFLICTYLMCINVLNLSAAGSAHEVGDQGEDGQVIRGPRKNTFNPHEADQSFRYNPFSWRTALANLDRLGAGPWPYYASVIYFVGVLIFFVGLGAELVPISHELTEMMVCISFVMGSFCFVVGGLAECIENDVFTTKPWSCKKFTTGCAGALLNTIGAVIFLIGSILMYPGSDNRYTSSFLFGVGSVVFLLGAGAQIIMWKDEQFGLTFLAALNNLGGPNGGPLVIVSASENHVLGNVQEEATFTARGAAFIMIYCLAGTLSTYNFLTSLKHGWHTQRTSTFIVETSFDAWLPFIFAHLLMLLNSAVVRVPKSAPFHQLYIGSRLLAVVMVISGTGLFVESLSSAKDGHIERQAACNTCPLGWMPSCASPDAVTFT